MKIAPVILLLAIGAQAVPPHDPHENPEADVNAMPMAADGLIFGERLPWRSTITSTGSAATRSK